MHTINSSDPGTDFLRREIIHSVVVLPSRQRFLRVMECPKVTSTSSFEISTFDLKWEKDCIAIGSYQEDWIRFQVLSKGTATAAGRGSRDWARFSLIGPIEQTLFDWLAFLVCRIEQRILRLPHVSYDIFVAIGKSKSLRRWRTPSDGFQGKLAIGNRDCTQFLKQL